MNQPSLNRSSDLAGQCLNCGHLQFRPSYNTIVCWPGGCEECYQKTVIYIDAIEYHEIMGDR